MFGGAPGIKVGEGTPQSQKDVYIEKWDKVYPGVKANHNGKVARMHWPSYPHNLGSYICYKPGQFTTISGWEQTKVGNVYFAGDHCGGQFAGFMIGAAKSGREAAEALAVALKEKASWHKSSGH